LKYTAGAQLEIVSPNLIKTKSIADTSAIEYVITRVREKTHVEYEIICRSKRKDFDPNNEGSNLGFYMVTGRIYDKNN